MIKLFRIKQNEAIFVIITVLTITRGIYTFAASVYLTNALAMLWILYSYLCKTYQEYKRTVKPVIKLYVMPLVGMIIYTIILWTIKPPSGEGSVIGYYTRLFSNFLWLFIMIFYVYRALSIFGLRTFKLYLISFLCSYTIFSFIPALIKTGPISMIKYAMGNESYVEAMRWLEKTDVLLGLGVLFIFLFVTERKKLNKYKTSLMFAMILYLFLGNKRIEIAGIFCVLLYYYVIDSKLKNFKSKLVWLSVMQIVVVVFFIYLIYSNMLTAIALKQGINFNYRLDTWSYWVKQTHFSLLYPGLGSSYVDKETYNIVQSNGGFFYQGYVILNGMHSDLMKKYVELGFVPFVIWLWYITYYRIMSICKTKGKLVADICMLVSLLVYILYFTDNAFDYFDTVTATIVVVSVACFYGEDKNRCFYTGGIANE